MPAYHVLYGLKDNTLTELQRVPRVPVIRPWEAPRDMQLVLLSAIPRFAPIFYGVSALPSPGAPFLSLVVADTKEQILQPIALSASTTRYGQQVITWQIENKDFLQPSLRDDRQPEIEVLHPASKKTPDTRLAIRAIQF
jgi:hypothetical protein